MTGLPERPYPADQVTVSGPTEGPHYPENDRYQFGSWPQLVIETDGYGDLSAIDPYSGRRLTAPVCNTAGYGTGSANLSIYDQMRRLIDELERSEFWRRVPDASLLAGDVTPEDAQ